MKLFRFGEVGQEKPGAIVEGDRHVDVSQLGLDYDDAFFAGGGLLRLREWLSDHRDLCPLVDPGVRLGPCVARPSKLVCIGLNYAKHAAEGGMQLPKEPVIFLKANSALCGPGDDIIIPRNSQKTDYEVELAVVIGRRASYVNEQDAMSYVAGYSLFNDYSEREYQLERSGQWVKGKSCDTFAPLGPLLVTRDEIADPHNLRLWLKVNGEMRQDSNTSDLVFKIPALVSSVSQYMSLLPGDVISTGTPSGVGMGFKPPRFLKAGDVVEYGIDGVGSSRHRLVAYK